MYTENVVQIVEHQSIDEANTWLKRNHEKKIMFIQCHYYGEATGPLGQTRYKVTITYKQ